MPDAMLTDMSPGTLTASFERGHISPGDWEQRLAVPEEISLTDTLTVGLDGSKAELLRQIELYRQQRDALSQRISAAEAREQQVQADAAKLQQDKVALEVRCANMVDRDAKWAKDIEREQRDLAQQFRIRTEEMWQAQTAALEWQKQASALKEHLQQLQTGDAIVLSEWESYSHSLSVGLEKVKADLIETQQSMQAKYEEAMG